MPEANEQEQEQIEEIVNLFEDTTPTEPARKGYEYYAEKAEEEQKAAVSDDQKDGEQENVDDIDIPEKFKGKSMKDVVEAYKNLESEYGRRNTEVSTLRKLTDQLLELEKNPAEETQPKVDVSVDTLLESPGEVINEAVENNPRLKALEEKLLEADIKDSRQAFEAKHPDWVEVMNSEGFVNWVLESPVRQRLFQQADKNYDYETGTELLTLYKDTRGAAVKDATNQRNTEARQTAKDSVTEQSSAQEKPPVKKFRRTELIHLKLHNRAKYDAMLPEIMKAYAEDRVI